MYNLYIVVVDGCWRRTLIGQPKDLRIVSYDSLGIISRMSGSLSGQIFSNYFIPSTMQLNKVVFCAEPY